MNGPAPTPRTIDMDVQLNTHGKFHHRHPFLLVGAVCTALALIGLFIFWLAPGVPRIDREQLWIDTVHQGEFVRSTKGNGSLVPKNKRILTTTSTATVERVVAQPGTVVSEEDPILIMSNPALREQVQQAEVELASAESDEASKRLTLEGQIMDLESSLTTLKADYDYLSFQEERERKLRESDLISELQYTQTFQRKNALGRQLAIGAKRLMGMRQNVSGQVKNGRLRLEQLKRVVAQRQRTLEALEVKAGIAGTVASIDVSEGMQVQSGTTLGAIVQLTPLLAKINIPETQTRDVVQGMPVSLDMRGTPIQGRVLKIAPVVRNGAVEILVEPLGTLPGVARPDLALSGAIELGRMPDAITIARPPESRPNSRGFLYRLVNNKAVRTTVEFGKASDDRIEVLRGLKPGDKVVLTDMGPWSNPAVFKLK